MTDLKTKILDTVKNNNLRMIPRWKFILFSILSIAGILFAFLTAVFTFSFVLFILSRYGLLSMPFFEFINIVRRLSAIPIILFLITVVLLILIEIISRKYTFAFRTPLAVTLLTVTTLAVVSSFVVSQTNIHEHLRDFARNHNIDIMSHAYDRPLPYEKGEGGRVAMRGIVVGTGTDMLSVKLFDGQIITAYGTNTPEEVLLGDDVVIFGSLEGGAFKLDKVKDASPDWQFGMTPPQPLRGTPHPPVK